MFRHVNKEQLRVPARVDYLSELRDFVTKVGRRYGFSERVINAFKLSIDEAATNIIKHAYRDWDGDITLRVIVKKNSLTVVLIDQGKFFDPRSVQDPDLQRYVDIGKKGGLGIFIMRRLLDDIYYRKSEEGNELWLVKNRDVPRKRKLAVPTIPLTLKTKYWFYSIAIFSIILAIAYFVLFFQQKKVIENDFTSSGNEACSQLASDFNELLSADQRDELERYGAKDYPYIIAHAIRAMDKFKNSIHRGIMVEAFLLDNVNFILVSTDSSKSFVDVADSVVPGDADKLKDTVYLYSRPDGQEILHVLWPILGRSNHSIAQVHFLIDYQKVKDEFSRARFYYFNLALLVWVIGAAGLFLLIYLVMNPFRRLSEWVKAFGQPGVVEEMDIDTSSEVGEIAQAFSDITHKLKASQKNLAEQERLQKEMQVAQEIQQTLLPSEFPEVEGYEIASYYAAAKEVGGDYYDFVEVDKDTLGIVVADVSGKGVPGSLVMTMIRTALRTEARGIKDAAEVLARVNEFVVNDMKKGMFVTLFYVIIDSKRRRLNYASAGHNPMVLYRANANKTYYLNPRGFPIGISLPDKTLFRNSIESDTIALAEDDILIIYTDGVTEAMDDRRQLFGEERFLDVIRNYGQLQSEPFVEKLKEDLNAFTQGNPQNDDITLVAIKEKTSAEKVELSRAKKAFALISEGASIKDACDSARLSTYAYYNKYKEIFEKEGIESYEIAPDAEQIEAKHLSIEEKTKIYDIIRRFPEYGAKRISEELNSNYYSYTKINVSKIYEELVRARLNTRELREAFVQRGGRRRRIKPPGTPLLTIDGKVIIQKESYREPVEEGEAAQQPQAAKGRTKPAETTGEARKPEAIERQKENIPVEEAEEIEVTQNGVDEETLDLITIDADELFSTPIDELFDRRRARTIQVEQSDAHQADDIGSLIEDDLIFSDLNFSDELANAGGSAVDGGEPEQAADLDLPSDPNRGREIDPDELDFAALIEDGGGFHEPQPQPPQNDIMQGQHVEDVEIISETRNAGDVPEPELSDPFDEFLEWEEEGLISADGEIDSDITDQILRNELKEQLQIGDDALPIPGEGSWEIKEPPASVETGRAYDHDSQKLSFDELIDILDMDAASIDEHLSRATDSFSQKTKKHADKSPGHKDKDQKANIRESALAKAIQSYEDGDYGQAIAQFETLLTTFPDDVRIHTMLGNSYFKCHRYKEAASQYERVIALDPVNVDAYENLGVVYANHGNLPRAIEQWERIMEISPEKKYIKESITRARRLLKQLKE